MTKNLTNLYRKLEALKEQEQSHTLDMYDSRDGSDEYYFHACRKTEAKNYRKKLEAQIRELERQGA